MTNEEKRKNSSAISGAIAVWKDLVSLLRDSGLLLLVVLLVAFPTTLNSVLVKAGFEEGSFVGFKWKSIVNMSTWCPSSTQKIEYLECANP